MEDGLDGVELTHVHKIMNVMDKNVLTKSVNVTLPKIVKIHKNSLNLYYKFSNLLNKVLDQLFLLMLEDLPLTPLTINH